MSNKSKESPKGTQSGRTAGKLTRNNAAKPSRNGPYHHGKNQPKPVGKERFPHGKYQSGAAFDAICAKLEKGKKK